MVEYWLALLFAIAGGGVAIYTPGKPNRIVTLLVGAVAGFSVTTALVVVQRLVLSHFFTIRLMADVTAPVDLFLVAGANTAAFFVGAVVGQGLESYVLPWRAARRKAAAAPPPPFQESPKT